MTRIKQVLLIVLAISLLTGCDMLSNMFKYRHTTEEFVETLLKEDYNKSINFMAMDNEAAKNINIDTLKAGLANFRKLVVDNWGTELEYSFMKSEKKFSTNEAENMPPNTTLLFVEFNNEKDFGIFQVLFDDRSQKIINIRTLDVREPIPAMTGFWLFAMLALCVPAFDIYMIRQIRRSNLKRKWLKYIAVVCLNLPSISYTAIGGLSFSLISLQVLFGFSFSYMGYMNSAWTFGLPLGGLFWFWKLRQSKNEIPEMEDAAEQDMETDLTSEPGKPMIE